MRKNLRENSATARTRHGQILPVVRAERRSRETFLVVEVAVAHRVRAMCVANGHGFLHLVRRNHDIAAADLGLCPEPLLVGSRHGKAPEDAKFIVTGEKIEKFARRTDMANYASVNRLRDIMKKLGIRAELTSQGAAPDSIIEISGKQFPLVEDW